MANWSTLKQAIANVIKANGNNEITGQILQNTLFAIVNSVGENYTFIGVADTSTEPGLPDGHVFYIATQAGIYSNFGGIEVAKNEVAILSNTEDNTWLKNTLITAATYKDIEDLNTKIDNLQVAGVDVATEEKLGGVKAKAKTEEDTQEVHIDPYTGKLYVAPIGDLTIVNNPDNDFNDLLRTEVAAVNTCIVISA